MAIPANVGPPKTIVFRYPGLEQKLRDQFVYQAYASVAEVTKQKFIPGNRLVLKFNEEVIGEGQIILVEKVTLATLTAYHAIVGGEQSGDTLRKGNGEKRRGDGRKHGEREIHPTLFRLLLCP